MLQLDLNDPWFRFGRLVAVGKHLEPDPEDEPEDEPEEEEEKELDEEAEEDEDNDDFPGPSELN